MKTKTITLIIFITLLNACVKKPTQTAQQSFFANLKSLCGQIFTGASTFPDDPDHDFAGQLLVADFNHCEQSQVRIKFDVGADRSRTWVVTESDQGLLLKHDHRHQDGTADEITNYGGWATDIGTEWRQHFAADQETADLIPAASTNVWMLQYDPDTQVLTYDLKRHDLPRYQAQLKPRK
jgi:hypothetical protein